MKQLLIPLLLLPLMATAQPDRPEWLDATTRRLFYPDDEYFVGFRSGHAQPGESIEEATERMKTGAQADLSERVRLHVESSTLDIVRSFQRQSDGGLHEVLTAYYEQQVRTSASVEVPNLHTLTWHSPHAREVAALVYVRKSDFARFYLGRIEQLLGKMDLALEATLRLEREGAKLKACATADEALGLAPAVEYAQCMAAIADAQATPESLQLPRHKALVAQLAEAAHRLRHATALHLDCRASLGSGDYRGLEADLKGLLSEQGCHFTDTLAHADYDIRVEAGVLNVTPMAGAARFVYVDGTLSLRNRTTGKRLYEGRLSALQPGHPDGIKGGDPDAEKAARLAYREAARIAADAILKLIQE